MSEPRFGDDAVRVPDMDQAMCRKHLFELVPQHVPADVTWQARWAIVAIELVKQAIASPVVQGRIGKDIDPTVASLVLQEVCPLCCFLTSDQFAAAVKGRDDAIARIRQRRLVPPGGGSRVSRVRVFERLAVVVEMLLEAVGNTPGPILEREQRERELGVTLPRPEQVW